MQRLKEEFLNKLDSFIPLTGKHILEIGCGNGSRSVTIAERCEKLTAVEPDVSLVESAIQEMARKNINYLQAKAESLPFEDNLFDLCIFTLSLHHVPKDRMAVAIDEAVRVVKKHGYIVFLEPGMKGSFFETEIQFGASDGDERKEKAYAYFSMLNHASIVELCEMQDETIFEFHSAEEFILNMHPNKNLDALDSFLKDKNYILNAERRINIFRPKK